MMISDKISSWLASVVVCSLLLAAGCAPPAEEAAKPEVRPEERMPKTTPEKAVTLALKFVPQDSTTYKVVTEAQRSIKWEGPLPDESTFKDGRNRNIIEMTFTQQIQSVDDKGNAVAKITIDGLRYYSVIKDNLILDFDNSTAKDPNHPLARLIGQSYTIAIAPTGEVTKVIDVKQAQMAARRGSSVPKKALAMLRSTNIKERHGLIHLPPADKNQLCTGDSWSSVKTFSFGLMGSKSYEKIHTLKEIKDEDNRRIATVEMNAIPTTEMAGQLHQQQAAGGFPEGFDSADTYTYTSQLKFDLTTGRVEKYLEKLQSEWIIALPSAEEGDDKEPVVLTMGVTRFYDLERID
jgi:hypothetical protein